MSKKKETWCPLGIYKPCKYNCEWMDADSEKCLFWRATKALEDLRQEIVDLTALLRSGVGSL